MTKEEARTLLSRAELEFFKALEPLSGREGGPLNAGQMLGAHTLVASTVYFVSVEVDKALTPAPRM